VSTFDLTRSLSALTNTSTPSNHRVNLLTVTFEIGELEYEVSCSSFSPPTKGSRDEPPDGGECYPSPFVRVLKDGQDHDVVTYDTFLLMFAVDRRASLAKADERACDALMERTLEELEDRYDDSYDPDSDRDDR
jgi:hypothetical protein